ncbi:tumor necrosis factor receptor superfamily member 4 isoform X2 [Epinephelus moara]|uniref:tumor necrosis factor receptor superfamily member 4 isoform X2 n=1 Tax=Epinephelus moara TaxID=300413 RepID=UPI00214EDC80|nr:tumor necrosis factor receptor superfamily member 4 isoform X2 [Epinephelus moara]
MQPLCAFTFLCTLSFLSPVLSRQCTDTEYAWPMDEPRLCCHMCTPGQHMAGRRQDICYIDCVPCTEGLYTEKYNVDMTCEVCVNCNKPNMEYKRNCSTTHNAVCGCKAGYACRDLSCKDCVPIPTSTIKTTLPPSTTALKPGTLTTLWEPSQPIKDTAWFLVIIALLCTGLALVVLTKIKPFLRWIKSKQGYFLAKEAAPAPQGSEDEEVSTPVQEVLGKCDQCDV